MSNPFNKLEDLDIADLRKLAKVNKIPTEKTWDKEAYIKALNNRRKGRTLARLVRDEDEEIPPGFVRIRIMKDSSGSESPVPVCINTFQTRIPRDVMVDVPNEVVEVLKNSTEVKTVQGTDKFGKEVTTTQTVRAYPFEILGQRAGESGAVRPSGNVASQSIREKYRDLFGRWPRADQQRKFQDIMITKRAKESGLFDNDELEALTSANNSKSD